MRKNSRSTAKNFVILSIEDKDLTPWVSWGGPGGYLRIKKPGEGSEWLHHVIIKRMGVDVPPGYVIDHINRKGIDNRRENLRVITLSQNASNRDAACIYEYKVPKMKKRWAVSLKREGKSISLGYYKTKEEAIEARNIFWVKEGIVFIE